MQKRKSLFLFLFTVVIMLLLQLPYLLSDPDMDIDGGRGPHTDEGLNTCQIRNFVNDHDLTFKKSDNLIKTPVFSVLLFVPFKIFGTKLLIGRLVILLLSIGVLGIIFSYNSYYRVFGFLFLLLVYSEYYIFHYFHYCLAEILSTVLIFSAIFYFVETFEKGHYIKSSFWSATLISLSYLVKIQFLYVLPILPLSIICCMCIKSGNKQFLVRQFLFTSIFLILYLLLYYLLWYLPNKDFFSYVMADQTSNRFTGFSNLFNHLHFVMQDYFYNGYLQYFTYGFYILFLVGFVFLFIRKSIRYRMLYITFTCWLIVELHKLPMTYLPSRYMLSLFFVMGLIITLVINELILSESRSILYKCMKGFSVLILLVLGIKNGMDYNTAIHRRSFVISEVNHYLGRYNFKGHPIIGAWAPTVSWDSKAISFPVWKDYFNDKNVLELYKPRVIVAEMDEVDSNRAFLDRNISIDSYADSIKYVKINKWNLKILWINQSFRSK
jgi:hypothetical protein